MASTDNWTRHRWGPWRRLCWILNIVDIDRFSNFSFCRIAVFLCLTHFPDDRTLIEKWKGDITSATAGWLKVCQILVTKLKSLIVFFHPLVFSRSISDFAVFLSLKRSNEPPIAGQESRCSALHPGTRNAGHCKVFDVVMFSIRTYFAVDSACWRSSPSSNLSTTWIL